MELSCRLVDVNKTVKLALPFTNMNTNPNMFVLL